MSFDDLLRRRRMVRSFSDQSIDPDVLEGVLGAALRAPSAGNTQGTDFVVLVGTAETARYWDITLPADRREHFAWPGLLRAPVLIIPVASRSAYLARYGEADKDATGLRDPERWTVPYWFVDAAFAAMLVQLAAIDAGLGALFFGIFDHTAALCAALGIPDGREPIGTIALGHPDTEHDRAGRSAARPARPRDDVLHRGGW